MLYACISNLTLLQLIHKMFLITWLNVLIKFRIPERPLPQDWNQFFQDNLVKIMCYRLHIIPIIFACNIVQSSDPSHNLLKDFLEIHVEVSFLIVGFIVPFRGVRCGLFRKPYSCGIRSDLMDIFLVKYWFNLLKPNEIANISYNKGLKAHIFQKKPN